MTNFYFLSPLRRLLPALLLGAAGAVRAQGVGIGTTAPNASAALDIVSSSKGVLLPRVSSTGSVSSPATGLIVYQTGSPAGYYYYDGTSWQQLATAGGTGFIRNQTTQQTGASFNVDGNGTVGTLTVGGAVTGSGASIAGVGVGVRADGGLNLGQNTAGNNLYLGYQAGQANTSGGSNVFSGYKTGQSNTTGSQNTFTGTQAGQATTTGNVNMLTGFVSGVNNTTGTNNTFTGGGQRAEQHHGQ